MFDLYSFAVGFAIATVLFGFIILAVPLEGEWKLGSVPHAHADGTSQSELAPNVIRAWRVKLEREHERKSARSTTLAPPPTEDER
jgi:hypothetical protein